MPTWLVFNTNPNSNAIFNSYMRVYSPVDPNGAETELLFPSSFEAEQGFSLAKKNLIIAKQEAIQARELLSPISASILGYGPSTFAGSNNAAATVMARGTFSLFFFIFTSF